MHACVLESASAWDVSHHALLKHAVSEDRAINFRMKSNPSIDPPSFGVETTQLFTFMFVQESPVLVTGISTALCCHSPCVQAKLQGESMPWSRTRTMTMYSQWKPVTVTSDPRKGSCNSRRAGLRGIFSSQSRGPYYQAWPRDLDLAVSRRFCWRTARSFPL